jgi:hypothetical protein
MRRDAAQRADQRRECHSNGTFKAQWPFGPGERAIEGLREALTARMSDDAVWFSSRA